MTCGTSVTHAEPSWTSAVRPGGSSASMEWVGTRQCTNPTSSHDVRKTGVVTVTDPDAGAKLDTFIRRVQAILTRYDGALLQLTIGDKGSYLYAAFGAPTAHEDDARRAAHAALACLALPEAICWPSGLNATARTAP